MPDDTIPAGLVGARIESVEKIERDGLNTYRLDTDAGAFEIHAVAWSDVLSNATDGESDDLELFVSFTEVTR